MKKYLYYSTLFSICTESFLFHYIVDIRLFYLIVLLNFIILLITENIRFSKGLLIFYSCLLFSVFIGLSSGLNFVTNIVAQFFGIFFISLYYYNFYKIFESQIVKIFHDYVYLCFALVIIGTPLYLFDIYESNFVGFHSILSERMNYGALVLPAFFYSFKNKSFPRYIYKILFFSIILTGSSIIILGFGFSILLMPNKIRAINLGLSMLVISFLFFGLYNFYDNFKLRIDDTSKGYSQRDLSGVNLSTYALLSNLYISTKSFTENPILGSGLGSHEFSHDKYIHEIDGISDFENHKSLNSKDANSLFLRVLSEMGLLGIVGIFFFIRKYYVNMRMDDNFNFISKAILIYFFCKLFRLGHYFSPEMYFLIFGYYFSNKYMLNKSKNIYNLD